MKHLVRTTALSGEAIRPSDALHRFQDAAVRDVSILRADQRETNCPACAAAGDPAFERESFAFLECRRCASVFVSPRPSASAVRRFYQETEAGRLRAEYLLAAGAERLRHVVRSRVDWVANYVVAPGARPRLLDVGTVSPAFLAESRDQHVMSACQATEVPPGLEAAVLAAGADIVSVPPAAGVSVVTAFEQLEHQSDPAGFLESVRRWLQPGGWFFATTRSISGFDLQVLWDKAPYLVVPDHLNLLSIEGLQRLFERGGFDVVELSTPGQLDLELVERAASEAGIALPRFVRSLFQRGEACREDFQELLQRHRLSSHVRIAARLPAR